MGIAKLDSDDNGTVLGYGGLGTAIFQIWYLSLSCLLFNNRRLLIAFLDVVGVVWRSRVCAMASYITTRWKKATAR